MAGLAEALKAYEDSVKNLEAAQVEKDRALKALRAAMPSELLATLASSNGPKTESQTGKRTRVSLTDEQKKELRGYMEGAIRAAGAGGITGPDLEQAAKTEAGDKFAVTTSALNEARNKLIKDGTIEKKGDLKKTRWHVKGKGKSK